MNGNTIIDGSYRTVEGDRVWIPHTLNWLRSLAHVSKGKRDPSAGAGHDNLEVMSEAIEALARYNDNLEELSVKGLPGIKPFVRMDMEPQERVHLIESMIMTSTHDRDRSKDLDWWKRKCITSDK